jgi:hypothetical protein
VRSRWLPVVALAATVFCRVPSFVRPVMDPDETTFASIAALMNAGGRLYADGGVDNKFPAIYWTYAATFRVFGRYAMGAVHAVELLVVIATALLLGWCARRMSQSERAGWLAVLFYGVFTSVYYPKMIAANTEIFMMLPLTAAFALVLSRRSGALLAAGALIAAGCLYKQIAIVMLPVPMVAALADRRWLRALLPVVGFAAVMGLVTAWFQHQGTREAWWHWTVTRLVSHYGPSAWRLRDYLAALAVGVGPFVAAALVPVAGAAAVVARFRRTTPDERLALLWLLLSIAGVGAGGRFFGHYFLQVAAPLVLLAAIEIDRRLTRPLAIGVGVMTALPALGFAVLALVSDPITQGFEGAPAGFDELAAHVRTQTQAGDRIFVWGLGGPFYQAADRLPATRFVGFLRGLGRDRNEPPEHAWDVGADVWRDLLADFAAHPPVLALDTSTADYFNYGNYPVSRFPELAGWMSAHCRKDTTIGRVDVYRCR